MIVLSGFANAGELPGFSAGVWPGEQVLTFGYHPEIRVHINTPAAINMDKAKPVKLILFALPNGNTIEQTAGKIMQEGDDWHYGIQHIAAQTRWLRKQDTTCNYVVFYLEAKQKSWPAWKRKYEDSYREIVKGLIEYVEALFGDYQTSIVLTGHSGGGRFIFSCLDAFVEIPDKIERIAFLDSNYGYEYAYGDQLSKWLDASADHCLSVLAYNDSIALYKGKRFVSDTGGTWYRSKMMQKYLSRDFTFNSNEDSSFIRHHALNGRISILLKKNPLREIYHTVQVELNGFIHTMLSGTDAENGDYQYYGDRIYDHLVQAEEDSAAGLLIPPRLPEAPGGSVVLESLTGLAFEEREAIILRELSSGNMPDFLRQLITLSASLEDSSGQLRRVKYRVMPDYLAIGSDSDYVRIPLGPVTAQKLADQFGASLPTRKLVDDIYRQAEVKVEPVTYYPVGNANEKVDKFVEHHWAIEELRKAANGVPGQLIAGIKKDIVVSNLIVDPQRPEHVTIYGWHRLTGKAIQPQTNIHIDWYVDYSHGARLLDRRVWIDGQVHDLEAILQDPVLYKLFSDEEAPMVHPRYPTVKIAKEN